MYLFAGAAAAMARAATGQPDLVAPDAVLLYTHADLKDTDFVAPLVCALWACSSLCSNSQLFASPTQFRCRQDRAPISGGDRRQGGARMFKYLLVRVDVKDSQFRLSSRHASGFNDLLMRGWFPPRGLRRTIRAYPAVNGRRCWRCAPIN